MISAAAKCLRESFTPILVALFVTLFGYTACVGETNKPTAAPKWVTLSGCQFFSEDFNDGDSFHVKYGPREFIFRLYFVDTPEVEDTYPDRIREQCEYFGVTREEHRKIGAAAKTMTAALLKQKFFVTTRWQNAMGRSRLPRYYALIAVGGEDLAAILVSRGLARAKGTVAVPPGGGKAKDQMEQLKQLEQVAKTKRVGIWAHSTKTARPPPPPAAH